MTDLVSFGTTAANFSLIRWHKWDELTAKMTRNHELSVVAAILDRMSTGSSPGKRRLAGVTTTRELVASGTSPAMIRALVRRVELIPVCRGAYADAARARRILSRRGGRQLLRATAAVAITGPGSALSHETAAMIHRIDLIRQPDSLVTLTRTPGSNRAHGPGIHVHSASLPPGHVTTKFGSPVTTAARTVIDLARTMPFADGVVAADSAIHKRLTSKPEMQAVLTACSRWPGLAKATKVVAFASGLAESPLESIARVVFDEFGLPPPALQYWISADFKAIGRVDFYWEQYKTIVEVDGAMKYEDPTRAKAQLWRDKKLRAAGYEVEHFDWQEITTSPATVVASIRAAFERGSRPRASGPAA
jgi:Protein of unknown function (DUF559)